MNEQKARRLLRDRSGGLCEIGPGCLAAEAHHRKNRSQGGTWDLDNLLHVCSDHHRWVTTHPAGARLKGWALRRGQDPATEPVFLGRYGYALLTADGHLIHTTERRAV